MDFQQRLGRATDRYESDKAKIEAQLAAATERRDSVVLQAVAAGLTRRKIAEFARISHQRVQQIVSDAQSPRKTKP